MAAYPTAFDHRVILAWRWWIRDVAQGEGKELSWELKDLLRAVPSIQCLCNCAPTSLGGRLASSMVKEQGGSRRLIFCACSPSFGVLECLE